VGRTAPSVARWLGEVRDVFAPPTVKLLQKDAVERLDLTRLLLEPELLETLEMDVDLAVALVSLSDGMAEDVRARARAVVDQVIQELAKTLRGPVEQAVRGTLRRRRSRRPRGGDIDWNRTILKNLRHYDAVRKTVVPETLVGTSRHGTRLDHVVLCVDQSGSMSASLVYAAIAASALAQVPSIATRLLAFDTRVVDLTEHIHDPVDVLFGAQLGGGTDIGGTLRAVEEDLVSPQRTTVVLMSDLFEGPTARGLLQVVQRLCDSGVRMVGLLAVSNDGTPSYDAGTADRLRRLGMPCLACTPGELGSLLAAALDGRDLTAWGRGRGLT
jgi:uncharacterized protein with von Willebrand factor type A (vWA) domain